MLTAFNLDWENGDKIGRKDVEKKLHELLSHAGCSYIAKKYTQKPQWVHDAKQYIIDMLTDEKTLALDGDLMLNDWFPEVEADIFLSHSHQDIDIALRIKCLLEDAFGLKVFVDSTVWQYADELLKAIDDIYAINDQNQCNYRYDYRKRNQTTAIVHLMLSTALTKMMNKAKVVFFLNTNNSVLENPLNITIANNRKESTVQIASPWIYHELMMSKILYENQVHLQEQSQVPLTESFQNILADFSVDISHMKNISFRAFQRWSYSLLQDQIDWMHSNILSTRCEDEYVNYCFDKLYKEIIHFEDYQQWENIRND